MGRTFFLRQRSYHFRRNWGYISFQFPFKSFYLFPRAFFETSKHEMDKFLLLGIHTRKRIMVALPLTTSFSFMNFIKDRFIWIDMRTQLRCIARIHVPYLKRSTEKKCRTGADSSSRKKELTEPGSLTNRVELLTNTNI
ncbi:hypothetical protein BS78_K082800 [Paspalum vaginatum]|uniref:Uncharacterized protein n=1 Tax=Paspalum vaginatum TaxID=158149 RepID=A0A9W7XCI3_9POAL|nr:hypothetical protein BS78_K082800 [Paspalum vaginatum]